VANRKPPEPDDKSIIIAMVVPSLCFCKQSCKQELGKPLKNSLFLFANCLENRLESNCNDKLIERLVLCNVLKVVILAKKPAKKKKAKPLLINDFFFAIIF
jgi:hypothetical protein